MLARFTGGEGAWLRRARGGKVWPRRDAGEETTMGMGGEITGASAGVVKQGDFEATTVAVCRLPLLLGVWAT